MNDLLKRWNVLGYEYEIDEDENGEFVKFEDLQVRLAEVEKYNEEILRKDVQKMFEYNILVKENRELREELELSVQLREKVEEEAEKELLAAKKVVDAARAVCGNGEPNDAFEDLEKLTNSVAAYDAALGNK